MPDHAIASGQTLARPAPLGGGAPALGCSRKVSTRVLADVVRALDALLLLLAGAAAGPLLAGAGVEGRAALASAAAAALVGFAALQLRGAYSVRDLRRPALQARAALLGVAPAALAWAAVPLTGAAAPPDAAPAVLVSAAAWGAAAFGLLSAHRFAVRRCLEALERRGRLAERVALFGAPPEAMRHLRTLAAAGKEPVEVVGIFDDGAAWREERHPVAGNADDLIDLSRRERVDVILVAPEPGGGVAVAESGVLARLGTTVADIAVVPAAGAAATLGVPTRAIGACPTVVVDERPIRDWAAVLKGAFDRCAAAALLVLLLPALAGVALAIKLDSPGPVIFRQRRRGFNDQIFEVCKFRTMHHAMRDPNADRLTLRNDPRVTRIGNWLRRQSIDELPQLLNVLRGEMSLVGPRPHPLGAKVGTRPYADVVDNYSRRHRVKPGMTGWAQVNGWRGETMSEHQIQQRVSHDLHYIENWSFALDLKILLLTVRKGFRGEEVF